MSLVLRWEDPPPTSRKRPGHWQQFAAELATSPGQWGLACENQTPKYAYDSVGKALRRAGCEVQTRMVNGEVSVWARWPEATST